ncbi:hypothetical protein BDV93DRAFT_511346 [Ceratobasidium sp. AG-I]|nr:hypothetical protein BDV93DRAFT_511346 [Ceratobasidium sp. AG-I]
MESPSFLMTARSHSIVKKSSTDGGYQAISWLWRTKAAENGEEWQVEGLSGLELANDEEELKLLKREIVMAARDFQTTQEVWKFKSQSFNRVPGMKEYATQRSNFFDTQFALPPSVAHGSNASIG